MAGCLNISVHRRSVFQSCRHSLPKCYGLFGQTCLERLPDVLTNRMKAVDARTVAIYEGSHLHDSSIPGHLVIKSQSSASDGGA
jgi:hypothetical protein